ncbi:S-adenosyl-L-methionine-dependent methyltransferase [Neohortaea acidophila]|uniref:S-adenosyl-L-methionine-dependent methyltransferase n=1 Tax=Neohortaea acidophila TaxID=245834 RepID=A0A6A6Q378_9PEZI|nr:S-adenosyl-L-methionine-dependent methyltransferase [Neohortaea acidophila]KAF2486464.1 S-adenosyl-L-methionine-dependent methyltransferase [Neohortaea acidophila]
MREHGFFYTSLDELLVLNVTLVSTSDIHTNMATSTDEEISALLQQIAVQGQDWKKGTAGAREALLDSASRLRSSLLTPLETLLLTQWSQPTVNAALLLGTQIGLFEALAAQNGAPKSSKAIADLTTPSAEPLLVARMLRLLASTNYVRETEADVFAPTPFANAMTQQGYKDTVYLMCTNFQHGHTNVAEYFKQNGYKSPDSVLFTPLSHALGLKDVSVYEYWGKLNPKAGAKFASCMATYTSDRPAWFQEGYYPVKDRLITGARSGPTETFMVDLGGSTGHDLTRLLQAFGPQIPGKLVLQDRPEVVKLAEKEAAPEVVKMPHDFFLEQPVTRARAYYFHSIVHNWPDEDVLSIFRALVPALEKGYSKVIICDAVLPNKGAHWLATAMDWEVMTALASRERTVEEFTALLGSVGLKITGIFTHPQAVDSIVEAELA